MAECDDASGVALVANPGQHWDRLLVEYSEMTRGLVPLERVKAMVRPGRTDGATP